MLDAWFNDGMERVSGWYKTTNPAGHGLRCHRIDRARQRGHVSRGLDPLAANPTARAALVEQAARAQRRPLRHLPFRLAMWISTSRRRRAWRADRLSVKAFRRQVSNQPISSWRWSIAVRWVCSSAGLDVFANSTTIGALRSSRQSAQHAAWTVRSTNLAAGC